MNIIDVKVAPASIRGVTLAKIMDVCMYVFRRVNFQIKTYQWFDWIGGGVFVRRESFGETISCCRI